jgi:hypothetical protein
MNLLALYQAEVARRYKEGVPADEQPSSLARRATRSAPQRATSFYKRQVLWGRRR